MNKVERIRLYLTKFIKRLRRKSKESTELDGIEVNLYTFYKKNNLEYKHPVVSYKQYIYKNNELDIWIKNKKYTC
tara:strand:- start:47 stop:271 length:225 start_codon:yes stop_codon:yes gene_type:complete